MSLRMGASSSTTRIVCWVISSTLRSGRFAELPGAHRGRQHDGEAGAPAGSFIDPDGATMPDNDGRTDGEPQPLAGHVRSRRRAPAEEGLEDPLPVFGRYARPRVLHAELQPVAHANASADPDGTRRW